MGQAVLSALLSVVIPAAIVVLAGYLAGKRLELDLSTLTKLTLYILSPALIVDSMLNTELPAREGLSIVLAFAIATGILFLVVALIAHFGRLPLPVRTSLLASTLFPNTGNLGLSLTLLALGQEGLQRAIVTYLASAVLVFGFGPALVSGQGLRRGIKTTIRLPLMWGLVLGIVLRALNIEIPLGIDDGIHLLAQAAVPVLLITLGMQISRTRFAPGASDFFTSALRLGGGPIAAYAAGRIVGLDHLAMQVFVLQCATPTAVNALLVAAEFGGDSSRAARAVVLSTILAFGTLPIVMWLMGI